MNIDTMRFVDYYVGVPLCLLASLWVRLCSFFQFSPQVKTRIQRVAFIELSEMGSAILADAALRWTTKQNAEVYFVIFKRNVASLRLLGTVPEKNIFLIREHNIFILIWDTCRYLLWARQKKLDAIVDLELFSRYTSLLTAFSGVEKRVGFYSFHNEGLYRGEILTHRVAYNPHIHIAKNFMALVKSLFSESMDLPFFKGHIEDSEIQVAKAAASNESVSRLRAALSSSHPILKQTIDFLSNEVGLREGLRQAGVSLVLFNCAGGEFLPQRRWPVSSYAKLAQKILDQHPKAIILLTGSPQEKDEVDPIAKRVSHDRLINFAGQILFEDLIALYQASTLLLTNDSGPAHFASTTDIPTFVFFGPETPKLYGSLGRFYPITADYACSPCVTAFNHRKTPCGDNRCLQVISPDFVYQKISSEII